MIPPCAPLQDDGTGGGDLPIQAAGEDVQAVPELALPADHEFLTAMPAPVIAPGIGMGTMEWVDGSHAAEAMYDATLAYLRQGGRHLDCAEIYSTAAQVGRAIADSGVPRAELHVTTKLAGLPVNAGGAHSPASYDAVRARLKAHLEALGLDHADLLLMHWPGPPVSPDLHPTEPFCAARASEFLGNPDALASGCTWDYFDEHVDAAWANMRRLRDAGFCKRIGVSNFNAAHLERLARSDGSEAPDANQLFVDVTHQQHDPITAMRAKGIVPIAYRALAFLPVVAMAAEMGDGTQATLEGLRDALGAASVQQLVLAWLVRRGVHVLAKTADEARAVQNLGAVELSASPHWPPGKADDLLLEVDGSELVACVGGDDECARAFMTMAPPEAGAK